MFWNSVLGKFTPLPYVAVSAVAVVAGVVCVLARHTGGAIEAWLGLAGVDFKLAPARNDVTILIADL